MKFSHTLLEYERVKPIYENKKKPEGPYKDNLRLFFQALSRLLQPGGAFGRPNVNRLFHLLPHRFFPRLVEP